MIYDIIYEILFIKYKKYSLYERGSFPADHMTTLGLQAKPRYKTSLKISLKQTLKKILKNSLKTLEKLSKNCIKLATGKFYL